MIQPVKMDSVFELAMSYYSKVSTSYLDQISEVTVRMNIDLATQQKIRRGDLFLYPDYFQKVSTNRFSPKYFTDEFFNFLLDNGHFSTLYKSSHDMSLVNTWLLNYYEFKSTGEVLNYNAPLQESTLVRADSLLSNHPEALKLNNNLVRLILIEYYLEKKQYESVKLFIKS